MDSPACNSPSRTDRDSSVLASSPEERRVTRGVANRFRAKGKADFSKLKESRKTKESASNNTEYSCSKKWSQSSSIEANSGTQSVDRIIRQTDELINRVNLTNEELSSENSLKRKSPKQIDRMYHSRKGKVYSPSKTYLESSSESGTEEEISSQSKGRGKTKSNKAKDKTVKNPIMKSKSKIAPVVTKDEADIELGYTREKWMEMAPAALGARCLEHLAELERQRIVYQHLWYSSW